MVTVLSAQCFVPGALRAALAAVALALVLGACSGGNAPSNGPVVPDLSGDRKSADELLPPAVNLDDAPTPEHKGLARLLPADGLVRDSVRYQGWNADLADASEYEGAGAALPSVFAIYRSAGYKVVTDPETKEEGFTQEYPQEVRLFLVRGPEAVATELLLMKAESKLQANGFTPQDPIHIALGRNNEPEIKRWIAIERGENADRVYVAYLKTVGDLLIYALEVEDAPKLTGPGDSQLPRVLDDQRGSRVGAQVIALILHALNG
jgi:hypothetical protein